MSVRPLPQVDPSQLVGNGLRNLVTLLAASEDGIGNLALSLASVADVADAGNREYVITGLHVMRAYVCGVHCSAGGWGLFRSGGAPTDAGRRERQEAAAGLGIVAMALQFVGSVEGAVAQEAILLLESCLAGEAWNSGLRLVQAQVLVAPPTTPPRTPRWSAFSLDCRCI